MDGIRPDRDELERHVKQHASPGQPRKRKSAVPGSPDTAKAVEQYVRLTRPAQAALVIIFIMLVAIAVAGYWNYTRQIRVIDQMQAQLEEASRQVRQSNLVIARLEGELQSTDSTLQQSGNEVARQLKFLDSEIRKLWDVSNKRNKAWIRQAQKDIESLKSRTGGLSAELQTLENSFQNQSKLIEQIQTDATAMSVRQAAMDEVLSRTNESLSAVQVSLASLQKQVSEIQSGLQRQEKQTAALLSRLDKLEARLASTEELARVFDQARQQLVGRYLSLDKRLKAIEKKAQPAK
ncbi:hypothetical protein AAIA72_03590 [Hahella sp. SMD15-11]|uniref:Chromosome partition protein Smc n=1 Tax=Thermohahella caldifontis TaxID=3142973 RepID=A0AB39UY03_9GAMM